MDHWERGIFNFLDKEEAVSLMPDVILKKTQQIIVRKNLVYVGVGVIFRPNGNELEILLTQEARADCKYSWYLPAGRVEPDETLEVIVQEGMMREVKEETGLLCQSRGLICVQLKPSPHYLWARFTFLADATGGALKVEPDEESLGASWFDVEDVLHSRNPKLRCDDILPLIRLGKERFSVAKSVLAAHIPRSTANLLCRLCCYHRRNEKVMVLLRTVGTQVKLPIVEFSIDCHIYNVILSLLNEVFGQDQVSFDEMKVISIECSPKPAGRNDGFCITLLCEIKSQTGNDGHVEIPVAGRNAGYSVENFISESSISKIESWARFGCKI